MNRDLPFDPYFRPADRISTIEEKIIIAAFAAPGLLATEQARFVLGAVGEPMLIAQNQTSEVLLVAYQSNDFRNISGRFAGHRESLFPGISFFFTTSASATRRTLHGVGNSLIIFVPVLSATPRTIRGLHSTPPFAIAAYPVTS